MIRLPIIPETAPFTPEQRAWLNGFFAGIFSQSPPDASLTAAPLESSKAVGEPLLVLFGSQTGTAEGLAKRVAKDARHRGFAPKVLALNDCAQAQLTAGGKTVIITSTWGEGEPPDNALSFWAWLKEDSAPRLDRLHYAVLGLGDRNYADFCGASKKFDARLESLGARRLTSRGECDVDYEAPARDWMEALWGRLGGKPASTNGQVELNDSTHTNGAVVSTFGKSNPFPARLIRNVLLNKPGSEKEVRHFEISLAGSGLNYEAGDALGVMPANCVELVDRILATLHLNGEELVQVGNGSTSLRAALIGHYDLGKPSTELLATIAKSAPASELASLILPERRDELMKWLYGRDVLEVLGLLASPLSREQFVPLLRRLSPRLYSISSSPKAHPGETHLTVGAVRFERGGRSRKGVASTHLADRVGETEVVKVFVQPSHGFKPPADGDAPMIMVGPGTGIAPFRAFLQERQAIGAKGRNWLYFGDQKRATDFLYEEEIAAWTKSGLLTRLDLAFSRDQKEKIYVQDRFLANAAEVWSWLEAGAHFYVCGDASRMARDVDAALHKVVERMSGKSAAEATAYVAKLKSDKRYQRDVY